MQIFEKKDDFFKDYYNNLYEERLAAGTEGLTAGSTTAGSREQSYKAFEKRLGEAEATAYLANVKRMAARTNYGYDEILGYSKLLLNSYNPGETFGLLTTLSDATAGLNLSSADVEMFIKGFSRMRTTGKVTQEYLNYFSERGVDVYEALARGTGADKAKIADMVTRGKIKGADAAEYIVEFLNESYSGLSDELMATYDAMMANLQDVRTNVEEGYGTGYNEERKSVVQAMTDALDGKLGEKLTWLNELTGSAQGYADNLKDSYWMDVMEAVFTGDTKLNEGVVFDEKTQAKVDKYRSDYVMALFRYDNAKTEEAKHKAALDMDRVRKQAEVLAGEVFGATDFNKALVDSQTDLITETRELAKKFQTWSDLYGQQQEKTKGQGGVVDTPDVSIPGDADGNGVLTRAEALAYANTRGNPTAWGLDYVPYDNYPALLHQGERVLTAQQAREADRGSGVSVVISGNEFHIREDADVDRVAEALLNKLQLAAVRG
ncbi:MAG: tape measure protein [Oscillospiraceae bacterium]|nr:tape measure protein [Oscillospiraceae bacterium]